MTLFCYIPYYVSCFMHYVLTLCKIMCMDVGHSGHVVEHQTFGYGDLDSKSPTAFSKLGQFSLSPIARVFRKGH